MSWVFILGLLAIMLAVVSSGQSGAEIKSWNAFKTLVHPETGRVQSTRNGTPEPLLVKSDRVIAIIAPNTDGLNDTAEPAPVYVKIDSGNRDWYTTQLDEMGVDHATDTAQSIWTQLLYTMGPFLLLVLLVLVVLDGH